MNNNTYGKRNRRKQAFEIPLNVKESIAEEAGDNFFNEEMYYDFKPDEIPSWLCKTPPIGFGVFD